MNRLAGKDFTRIRNIDETVVRDRERHVTDVILRRRPARRIDMVGIVGQEQHADAGRDGDCARSNVSIEILICYFLAAGSKPRGRSVGLSGKTWQRREREELDSLRSTIVVSGRSSSDRRKPALGDLGAGRVRDKPLTTGTWICEIA